jgi:ubiquinone/menaquinone biosynthesis C-methylase UbiE
VSSETWQSSLRSFFNERATIVPRVASHRELCFIAGREPRLWSDPELYQDMIDSIVEHCALDSRSSILEVGCAAGFLALGVAPRVKRYVGIDLAAATIKVARRHRLPNATFHVGDGSSLQFRAGSFDAAFCYDVFTNLPDFRFGAPIIREMVRTVRSGGRVLIGSVPDRAVHREFEERAQQVVRELDERYGRSGTDPQARQPGPLARVWRGVSRLSGRSPPQPAIVCYSFDRSDFLELARELGASVTLTDIHAKNPYAGFRFNAIYEIH